MTNTSLVLFGKSFSVVSKLLNLGNGSTWPGHIALSANKDFIREITKNSQIKIIVVAGTNGKTTTSKMITTILKEDKKKVIHNTSGANLLNGIASTFIQHANILGKITQDYAVFEVDENILPLFLRECTPDAIILLNLFRDQLDRYGEIDTIAKKWKDALQNLPSSTKLFLNADDPEIAYLGADTKATVQYFGLEEKSSNKQLQHASDSIYCPNCHTKLIYKQIYYSHLGEWSCPKCKLKRPKIDLSKTYFPLAGAYNKYNTLAAALFTQTEGVQKEIIEKALKKVKPAFGRQEIIEVAGKKVQLFLSKNPTSFNQSLETICYSERNEESSKNILFVLNDRIPDGKDISWIWDIDIEDYIKEFKNVTVSGDRVYDMALRIQYAQKNKKDSPVKLYENLEEAIRESLNTIQPNETLYILPTYSAMLEVRKILIGKKIL